MTTYEIRKCLEKLDNLPPLPNLAQLLLNFSYDDTEIKEFSNVIETNSTLTARLLKVANSAYFGWPEEIRTVEGAIIKVLGLAQAKGLVIVSILNGLFKTESRFFNLERHWFTSITCGILCQGLWRHVPIHFREELDNIYTHGLLHNIGLIALVHCAPAEMDKIFENKNKQNIGINNRCEEVFGMGYHQIGGALATTWRLPKDIVAAIGYHHQKDYRGGYWPITLLVGLCAEYADALYSGREPQNTFDAAAEIGLNSVEAEKERNALISQIEEVKELAGVLAAKAGE